MTDREIRKLRRADLLQLLITQMRENKKLEEELALCREELNRRQVIAAQAGSIAQAAMELSGVFEAAQEAADLYLSSVRHLAEADRPQEGENP